MPLVLAEPCRLAADPVGEMLVQLGRTTKSDGDAHLEQIQIRVAQQVLCLLKPQSRDVLIWGVLGQCVKIANELIFALVRQSTQFFNSDDRRNILFDIRKDGVIGFVFAVRSMFRDIRLEERIDIAFKCGVLDEIARPYAEMTLQRLRNDSR